MKLKKLKWGEGVSKSIEWNLGKKHGKFGFYEMFCMQHTVLRAKIIFLKSEMGCRSIKCNSFCENSIKHVY